MGFWGKLKRFFVFFVLFIAIASVLIFYSLYEEKKYRQSCKELGLECNEGNMHESVSHMQGWMGELLKKVEELEIWKQIDLDDNK